MGRKKREKEDIEIKLVPCPHGSVEVRKLACQIFRHGVLKQSGKQIDPHSSQRKCEYYLKNKLIYGCGKPFRVNVNYEDNSLTTELCGYI